MKASIHYSKSPALLIIILSALLMAKCDWFSEDPLYAGSWQYTDKLYAGDFTYNTTTTLTLTEKTFEEIYMLQRDNSSDIVSILATRGTLEVNGNEMTFTLSAVGECVKDIHNDCTASVEWFEKGTPTYNTYILYLEEIVDGEFEADEDYLWLVRDKNNDSDTEDEGEDIEFERL